LVRGFFLPNCQARSLGPQENLRPFFIGRKSAFPAYLPDMRQHIFFPCIPTRVTKVPAGPEWLHEIKGALGFPQGRRTAKHSVQFVLGVTINSMPNPKQTDPPDLAVAALMDAYEQIGRADERVFESEQDAARHPSDQQNRPAFPNRRSSHGRPALLGLIGLLLAACVCVAAFAWRSSYGDAAKLIITRWIPQRVSTSSLSLEKQEVPAQPIPPTADVATANAALPQRAPLAQTTPQDVASTAAPMSPELAQWLQTMARDLANMEQRIEQLKTSQEQMVRDNAAVAELKASQEQMSPYCQGFRAEPAAQNASTAADCHPNA
jgi:hypothetical protein